MAVNKEVPKRKVIIPINQRTDWLNARVLVADKGGLPSNVLHDEYLNGKEKRYRTVPNYYSAWAREMLAHPGKDGQFLRGLDIFDSRDRTVVPWNEIVRLGLADAILGPKRVLFIDPGIKLEGAQLERYKGIEVAVIRPESIIILDSVILVPGTAGEMDGRTGIPLEVSAERLRNLTPDQLRVLHLRDYLSARALVRYDASFGLDYGRVVNAYVSRVNAYGVAGVGLSEQSEAINSSQQFDRIFTEMAETQRRSIVGPMFK